MHHTFFARLRKWILFALLAISVTANGATSPLSMQGLSCELVIPSFVPNDKGVIQAKMVLKNIGEKPIKLCVWPPPRLSIAPDSLEENFSPDSKVWKDGPPQLKDYADHVIVLQPGKTAEFPFEITANNGKWPSAVSVIYGTGKPLAEKLGVWQGYIGDSKMGLAPVTDK
jgi:hypothetical protein